jgi:tetratricopeptide (TPR) repeat protein
MKQKEEEDKQNKLFEENNKEFCSQFLDDMNARKQQTEKKQQTAMTLKLKGNKYFKARKFLEALEQYMEALKLAPFDGTAILTNIAQVQPSFYPSLPFIGPSPLSSTPQAHIQLNNFEDALEFLDRALYLDPKCLKALSRKAHIFGERLVGKETDPKARIDLMTRAVDCMTKAHQMDPLNAEITSQFNELSQALEDLKNEEHVQQLTSHSNNSLLKDTLQLRSKAQEQEQGKAEAQDQQRTLETLLSSLSDPETSSQVETMASFAVFDRFKEILLSQISPQEQQGEEQGQRQPQKLTELLYETIVHALQENKSTQVYFRTSEVLKTLLLVIEQLLSQQQQQQGQQGQGQGQVLSKYLKILAVSLHNERPSKMFFIESYPHLLSLSLSLVSQATLPLDLLESLLTLLQSLASSSPSSSGSGSGAGVGGVSKARSLLLKQKEFVVNLSGAICRLVSLISPSSSPSGSGSVENALRTCCEIFKDLLFSEDGKKSILHQTAPTVVVAVFGSILQRYLDEEKSKGKRKEALPLLSDLAERSIEILLGCSQLEDLRPSFLNPLNSSSTSARESAGAGADTSASSEETNTAIQVILQLALSEEWIQSNGLAILMNLTIQDDQSMRQILFDSQALEVCLQVIKQHSNTIPHQEKELDSSRLRAIGLLSRLGTLAPAQQQLKQPDCYLALIKLFIANTQQLRHDTVTPHTATATNLTILRDESSQLIRLFASLTSPPEFCLSEAYGLGYLQMLLAYLPMPRMELQDITPQSVILPPQDTPLWNRNSTLLVGNIARCLIPFADHPIYSQAIFSSSSGPSASSSSRSYGVEKLVCMMATCGDIRVRKNIAIVLAKGCRVPEVKKRVEYFRGLQMIVELQHQLT